MLMLKCVFRNPYVAFQVMYTNNPDVAINFNRF